MLAQIRAAETPVGESVDCRSWWIGMPGSFVSCGSWRWYSGTCGWRCRGVFEPSPSGITSDQEYWEAQGGQCY